MVYIMRIITCYCCSCSHCCCCRCCYRSVLFGSDDNVHSVRDYDGCRPQLSSSKTWHVRNASMGRYTLAPRLELKVYLIQP